MPQEKGQAFIGRNRAPRVQIEYDVEDYGSEKKVRLPFIMGVVADLAGKNKSRLPPLEQRKFLEIDVDNFDDRLKALQPRVTFDVEDALSSKGGDNTMKVDITFQSMADFRPDAVARKVEATRKLLEMRERLSHLLTYMDGKHSAEQLIDQLLKDPALQQALAAAPKPGGQETAEPKPEDSAG